MNDDLRFSRPLGAARELGQNASSDEMLKSRVLLTGDRESLRLESGRACFLDSLRLLPRICPNVHVSLNNANSQLKREAHEIGKSASFSRELVYLEHEPSLGDFEAILSIGATVRSDLPWSAISSNGWNLHISSFGESCLPICGLFNPISSLAAASLGAAEVFKRIVRLKPAGGQLLKKQTFSLLTYESQGESGPKIPPTITLTHPLLLVGAGAIGNGIIHLLSQLNLIGKVIIVDSQKYGDENLGTCLRIASSNVGMDKAIFAESVLIENLEAKGYSESFQVFSKRLGKDVPYPSIILNALDNIETRRDVQDIWPQLIIDGAIGRFGCQASVHPINGDIACIRCQFPEENISSEKIQKDVSGLSDEKLMNPEQIVDSEDVQNAPLEKRDFLARRIGKTVCAVVSEATMASIMQKPAKGFAPSVPFVATYSAAMMTAELIKHLMGIKTSLSPRYQCDLLWGPQAGLLVDQARLKDCYCSSWHDNILKVHDVRYGG